jgi:hypothetical protein
MWLEEGRCREAEGILHNVITEIHDYTVLWDTAEILNQIAFFRILQDHLHDEFAPNPPDEQVEDHLLVSLLSQTRRILSQSEFDRALDSYPSLESGKYRRRLWQHMTSCPIFFQQTVLQIFSVIESIGNDTNSSAEVLSLAKWIIRLIGILEEVGMPPHSCGKYGERQEVVREAWHLLVTRFESIIGRDGGDREISSKLRAYCHRLSNNSHHSDMEGMELKEVMKSYNTAILESRPV